MANYKVIQDIESEDRIIGPLTLKQFIYAFIAAGFIGLGVLGYSRTGAWLIVTTAIIALPFIFLALPLGRDQPNEVWLLAQLNFFFKPRKRIWVQSSLPHPFIVTVNNQESANDWKNKQDSKDIENQVRRLSSILDSRGQIVPTENQTQPNNNPQQTDFEHEEKDNHLREHFHQLLNDHQQQDRANLDASWKQQINDNPNPSDNQSTVDTDSTIPVVSTVNSQTIDRQALESGIVLKLAQAGDLKISTLENTTYNNNNSNGNWPQPT